MLELATAGYSVAPSEALKMFRAHGLEDAGDQRAAMALFQDVSNRPHIRMNASVSCASVGRLEFRRGNVPGAIRWNRKSAVGHAPNLPGVLGWLFSSIQGGLEQELRAAMDVYHGIEETSIDQTRVFLTRKRADRFSGEWAPSSDSTAILRLDLDAGPILEGLFDLFRP